MDLTTYVDDLRRGLAVAAEAGGDDARAIAERLTATLDPAIRLVLLDALSTAADEITLELAPGSVELRLRTGEPEFVVVAGPSAAPSEQDADLQPPEPAAPTPADGEDDTIARLNLRLPGHLKARVEQAASGEQLSVNAWLVRVVADALATGDGGTRVRRRGGRVGESYTGWVR